MKNIITRFFNFKSVFFILFIGILVQNTAFSYPYGKTGHTATNGSGCYCHSSNSNSGVTLSLSGPTNVNINSTNSYSLTVSQSLSKVLAGVNIAVRNSLNGTVINNLTTSDSYLQLSGQELTHRSSPNDKSFSGGSATFDFTFNAPSTPGTYYIQAISLAANGNGTDDAGDVWNWLTPVAITVSAPTQTLSITSPNTALSLCSNSNYNISWTSTNVTNVKIELSTDGGSTFPTLLVASTPASTGNWMWSIPANAVGMTNKIKITDVNNPLLTTTSAANFSVNLPAQITEQPTNQLVCSGTTATFRVLASGGGLTYQWRKNGGALPNTNSNQLSVSNAVKGDEGNYDCIISGPCGSPITSNTATLTTKALPEVLTHPEPVSVCLGQPINLSITASGANITYQWIKNGNPISNATGSTFTIPAAALADSGIYLCLVKGDCNPSATSNSAKVSVIGPPSIIKNPANTSICLGSKLELSAQASGGNLTYVWKRNGLPITGQTSSTLLIANTSLSDEGSYTCQITNGCGDPVITSAVQVKVNKLASILSQPTPKSVTVGDDISLSITVENGGNLNYQWRRNQIDIQGANSASLTIKSATKTHEGSYDCKVTSQCGGVLTSQSVEVLVKEKQSGPLLTLLVNEFSFDTLTTDGATKNITASGIIKNSGGSDLSIKDINITGNEANAFKLLSDKSFSLKSGESANLEFSVKPINAGLNTAKMSFSSNSSESPILSLMVFGADIKIVSINGDLAFENTDINIKREKALTLKNNSNIPVNILSTSISGADASIFSIKDELTYPATIPVNGTVSLNIGFLPKEIRAHSAQVNLQVEYKDNPVVFLLSGSGVADVAINEISDLRIFSEGNKLIIKNKSTINNIEIYDIYSRRLLSESNLNVQDYSTDLLNVTNGIYFIIINNNIYKFIKY